MNSSPGATGDEREEQRKQAAERRNQQLRSMETTEMTATSSWGERMLPIALAAMEACWVDVIFIGLAGLGFLGMHEPFIPLWAPFLLIAGYRVLSNYLERREASKAAADEATYTDTPLAGTPLLIALVGVVTLFIIWSRIYAQTIFVLDPRWLLSLLNDILLLDSNAYLAIGIVALTVYFCWRGVRLARREIEPTYVFNMLRLGLGIILVVVLVRAGQESSGVVFHDEPVLFLLVALFLMLALVAHALARVTFVRHSHPLGLEGSIAAQERFVVLLLTSFGVAILLLAFFIGSVANPSFLADAQGPLSAAYNWLVDIVARVIVFLSTPFFLLYSLLAARLRYQSVLRLPKNTLGNSRFAKPSPPPGAVLLLVPILKVVLPLLFVAMVLTLIWLALRRRRVRLIANRRMEELRESVWSWELFWAQLKAFLYALFGRFFARRTPEVQGQVAEEAIEGPPAVRTIRELYRLLLKRAAERGYGRNKEETPYEFKQRLEEKTPLAEPRLETITAAYIATRYGGAEPDESEVARIRSAWAQIERSWNAVGAGTATARISSGSRPAQPGSDGTAPGPLAGNSGSR